MSDMKKKEKRGKQIFIFADGGARGNPGPAAVGFVLKDNSGKVLVRQGKKIGRATNNVAEYMAVIESLKWLINEFRVNESTSYRVTLLLDSQLVVNQLNGLYKIKNAGLRNLIVKVRQFEREIGGNVSYQHIPRSRNKEADLLVNQALDSSLIY